MVTRLKSSPMTAVPPMEQQLLDNIRAAYGGQPAILSPDQPHAEDPVDPSVAVYLLEKNAESGEWVPVNELLGMPPDCLEDDGEPSYDE